MEAELSEGESEERAQSKKQEIEERADWSNLKADALKLIADRLIINITDYICFRCVCKAWRATNPRSRSHPPQLPWLVLGCEDDFDRLVFYSFSDSRVHKIKLPTIGDMVVINGSSDGWLVLEDRPSSSISLLNPLTGVQIHLPSAPGQLRSTHDNADTSITKEFMQALIWKISMSSNPLATDQDCTMIVIASWNRALLSIRFGHDDDWSLLDDTTVYLDVIYFKGSFYAIDYTAQVFVFDSQLKKVAITEPRQESTDTLWQFAELSGELVVLGNMVSENPIVDEWEGTMTFTTERIDILKLNMEGVKVKHNMLWECPNGVRVLPDLPISHNEVGRLGTLTLSLPKVRQSGTLTLIWALQSMLVKHPYSP
ncbi:putative F-box protein At1g65770 [Musa acuminata AAA Group]|uniref:putative F-box protein At1g65770 n=1 Tax=Musa acuminata AAA Group TaxID=214697 RepID=UPI0031DE08C9